MILLRKKKDDSWLLLLLLLGLSGLKGIAQVDPTRPRAPTSTGAPPATEGNPATDMPTDKTGTMQKMMNYVVNFADRIGTTAGMVLDKSMNISAVGTTPEIPTSTPNAGVRYAERQIQLINAQPIITSQNGLNLVNNLGDPLASITTAVFDPVTRTYKTYTNNELLFNTMPAHKNNPTPPDAMTPVYPPSSNPPMMTATAIPHPQVLAVDTTGGFGEPLTVKRQTTPLPLVGLVDPNAVNHKSPTIIQPVSQPQPMTLPSLTQLNSMTKVLNPLVSPTNPLAQLQSFGQAQLNALLAAGQTLQGAFNNLQGIFPAIGTPITGARPVIIDAI